MDQLKLVTKCANLYEYILSLVLSLSLVGSALLTVTVLVVEGRELVVCGVVVVAVVVGAVAVAGVLWRTVVTSVFPPCTLTCCIGWGK